MATVTRPPKQTWNRADTNRRVRHPLQKLRGYIRSYVTLEGVAVFLLYVAIWFWAGLILDFGVFKLFGYDWVEEMPRTISIGSFQILRTSVLVILLGGLVAVVAFKVVIRLLREFRDTALALVMERRFPDQLGDRLITAVEMADPRLADKYGHSQHMVDLTIQDAADRVDKLPVTKVFNWKRLYLYGLTVLGLTAGLYVLTGAAYCVIAQEDTGKYFYRSRDVAAIWVERNVLLQDSLWPRSAYLEIIRFAGSKKDPSEMHISDANPSTALTVRGVKWVIADSTAPNGWRALRWQDLPAVLGHEPKVDLPEDWQGWTIDIDDLDGKVPPRLLPEGWHGKSIAYVQNDLGYPGVKGQEMIAGSNILPARGSGLPLLHASIALALHRDRLLQAQETLTGASALGALAAPVGSSPYLGLAAVVAGNTDAQPLILPRVKDALARARLLEATTKNLFHWREWTMDRIEDQLANKTIQEQLRDQPGAPKATFDRVFEELEELVEEGHMERTLRKLEIPSQIVLKIYGKAQTTTKDFQQGVENKYQDTVNLSESVRIQFQGADYYTPEKKVVLVPRPKVATIVTNRSEPAYIYYRIIGRVEVEAKEPDPEKRLIIKEQDRQAQMDLRGKRQQYLNVPAKITEQVCYIEVPISGDLELIAQTNEDLKEEVLVVPVGRQDDDKKADATARQGTRARFVKDGSVLSKRRFTLSFKNLTQVQDLKLKLVNEDGVEGECRLVITPKADDHPRVDVQMVRNVFRMKENVGYMVTPVAEVGMGGLIQDDRGLSRAEWRFKVAPYTEEAVATKLATMLTAHQLVPGGLSSSMMASSYLTILLRQMAEAEGDGGKKALPATPALHLIQGGFSQSLAAAAYMPWLASATGKVEDAESRLMQKFVEEVLKHKKDEIEADSLLERLTRQPPKEGLLTTINLNADEDFFSFEEHLARLKASGENVFQKRYLVELWVAATDNNIEVDQPVVSEDKKHFTFLVVGENELLAEIFREEEKLRATLDQIHQKLKTAKTRLDTQALPKLADDLGPEELQRKTTRTEEVREDIASSFRDIGGVLSAFNRILAELKANKIKKALTRVQEEICDPLRDMQDKKSGEFKAAEDAAALLAGLLEKDAKASQGPNKTVKLIPLKDREERSRAGLDAQKKLDALIKRLEKILLQIRETVGKDQLVRLLVEIEEKQRKQSELLEAHVKYIKDLLIKEVTDAKD